MTLRGNKSKPSRAHAETAGRGARETAREHAQEHAMMLDVDDIAVAREDDCVGSRGASYAAHAQWYTLVKIHEDGASPRAVSDAELAKLEARILQSGDAGALAAARRDAGALATTTTTTTTRASDDDELSMDDSAGGVDDDACGGAMRAMATTNATTMTMTGYAATSNHATSTLAGHQKPGGPCDHCGALDSPQWRRGPSSKPMLCNACGTRFRRTGNLGSSPLSRSATPSTTPTKRKAVAPPVVVAPVVVAAQGGRKKRHAPGLRAAVLTC